MEDSKIFEGEVLVVDKSTEAQHGYIVVSPRDATEWSELPAVRTV